ncbi:hypothetical protein ACIOJE_27295 [Kitasatospora sp. NPDC087861]|uniref:hypothetical protein n=1 Tax=Kitasatospora sp. NPDC087861 TaxID=3364070 RepID=UPI0038125C31
MAEDHSADLEKLVAALERGPLDVTDEERELLQRLPETMRLVARMVSGRRFDRAVGMALSDGAIVTEPMLAGLGDWFAQAAVTADGMALRSL